MNKLTRRQAFVAAAGAAVAPLAIASEAPQPGVAATIQSGLIDPLWDKEDWKKKARRELEILQERLRNQDKAKLVLSEFGFDLSECERVRKDICKKMPTVKNYRRRFVSKFYEQWQIAVWDKPMFRANDSQVWDAIIVTFRTNQDGFEMLDVDMWWED